MNTVVHREGRSRLCSIARIWQGWRAGARAGRCSVFLDRARPCSRPARSARDRHRPARAPGSRPTKRWRSAGRASVPALGLDGNLRRYWLRHCSRQRTTGHEIASRRQPFRVLAPGRRPRACTLARLERQRDPRRGQFPCRPGRAVLLPATALQVAPFHRRLILAPGGYRSSCNSRSPNVLHLLHYAGLGLRSGRRCSCRPWTRALFHPLDEGALDVPGRRRFSTPWTRALLTSLDEGAVPPPGRGRRSTPWTTMLLTSLDESAFPPPDDAALDVPGRGRVSAPGRRCP